jgi:uncharacterized protein
MARPLHFEILAADPQQTAGFYKEALGWEFTTWTGPQAYWLVTTGPEGTPGINGGIMGRHFQQPVINTVVVDALDDTIARVIAAGGSVARGPSDIPGIGRHAYCADPEGILFGVLEPVARDGC